MIVQIMETNELASGGFDKPWWDKLRKAKDGEMVLFRFLDGTSRGWVRRRPRGEEGEEGETGYDVVRTDDPEYMEAYVRDQAEMRRLKVTAAEYRALGGDEAEKAQKAPPPKPFEAKLPIFYQDGTRGPKEYLTHTEAIKEAEYYMREYYRSFEICRKLKSEIDAAREAEADARNRLKVSLVCFSVIWTLTVFLLALLAARPAMHV